MKAKYFLTAFTATASILSCASAYAACDGGESLVYAQRASEQNAGMDQPPQTSGVQPSQDNKDSILRQHAQDAFEQGGCREYNDYVDHMTSMTAAMLNAGDYSNAALAESHLRQAFPYNPGVQSVDQQGQNHDKARLTVNSYYYPSPSSNVVGGESYGIDTDLYSAPIDYNWRVFAGTTYAHETEGSAGVVGYNQERAGFEYQGVSLDAKIAPTYNLYHNSERGGFAANGEWTFNSAWSAGAAYDLFSRYTPLQALNAGITANKASANAAWKQDDTRMVTVEGDDLDFSDGNNRVIGGLTYVQYLYSEGDWTVSAIGNGGLSHDTANNNLAYYNPRMDATGTAGPRVTETLYRRYGMRYEHSLQVSPGAYWQESYGVSPVFDAVYGQTLQLNSGTKIGANISYNHQSFDGQVTDNVGFTVNWTQPF